MSNDGLSPEVLVTFYRRLYPFKSIFNWLNHEHTPTKLFTHREFAFTLAGDVYLRYHSFSNADELKKQVCSLNPQRFEIGPVYNAKPKDRKTLRSPLAPQLRELVFDIDMTDYDPIRTCCSNADICSRCWAFIAAAVRVLHSALQEEFGFKHMLWVYSGRRGIHLWISDKEAMALTDAQRKAVVGFLTVIPGHQKGRINVRLGSRSLPPSLQDALGKLKESFVELILKDQDLFIHQAAWEALLECIPNREVVAVLKEAWTKDVAKDSMDKWDDIKDQAVKSGKSGSHQRIAMQAAMEDIILQYTYPRLDAEVSKHRNHLLKAPFCIHPKTGRVCVPINPDLIDEFSPEKVPTVKQLLDEIDSFTAEAGTEHHSDWEKTSLKPYVDMLDKFTMNLMNEVRQEKRLVDTTW